MVEINENIGQITLKVVYYGPALSGKTTNLMRLHDFFEPQSCGDLMNFETKGDRTIFFDFLPVLGKTSGRYQIKLKLFTVPGQVAHDATRKAVLSRADAVVFVADSQRSRSLNNRESFENLEKNAGRVGLDFNRLPLVIQYNKQDLPDTLDAKTVLDRWKPTGIPVLFSSALYGTGIRKTFASILSKAYAELNDRHDLETRYGINKRHFLAMVPMEQGAS